MTRKARRGGIVLFGVLLIAIAFGEHYLALYIDKRRFPWGYADSGSPPLVGVWVGRFTTRSGTPLGMLIDIELAKLRSREIYTPFIRTSDGLWLEGRVFVCDAPSRVRRLQADGAPADPRASQFHLGMDLPDSAQPEGLTPSHIYGRFDGTDTLALEASLYLWRNGEAITTSNDPDTGPRRTPFTLRRGTEATFHSLCGEM